MTRSVALTLSSAFAALLMAGAAHAADYKVEAVGKSRAELRLAVSDAAFKACRAVYKGEAFADYERDGCVKDTVKLTLRKVESDYAKAARGDITVAGR